jgi:DNA-binding response OmpR family regulator
MVAGARVLVVEDSAMIAMDIEVMLQDAGHTVLGPLTSVAATLAFLAAERPDAVLLDLNLQDEVATPVANALVATGIPFALLTGMDNAAIDVALRRIPRLAKPFGSGDIREMVLSLLEPRPAPQLVEQV